MHRNAAQPGMAAWSLSRSGFQDQQISSPSYPQVIQGWVQSEEVLYDEHIRGLDPETGHDDLRLSRDLQSLGFG